MEGVARNVGDNPRAAAMQKPPLTPERKTIMSRHLNPLEKEFLIRQYKSNPRVKMADFCKSNGITDTTFRKWLKQYEEGGLDGLCRADAQIGSVLPDGVDQTEEALRREIIKLRIENERLKKNYTVETNERGEQVYVRLSPKNTK